MIKKKLVQCIKCPEGKLCVAWKSEYKDGKKISWCRYHWTGEKLKRKPKEEKVEETERQKRLEAWYKFIYNKYRGVCQETGAWLNFSKTHAAHILPKSKYDYFETDPRNGIYLSSHIHAIVDRGTSTQRKELKIWNHIQSVRKELLEEAGLTFDAEHWEHVTY